MMNVKGKISSFGGPADTGVTPDEGTALYWTDSQISWAPELFLEQQPAGTTGLARRLNPQALYCAMRWNYDEVPKHVLRRSVVKVTSEVNTLFLRPVDWGPNESTGRVIDVSPGALQRLGVETNDEVVAELLVAEPETGSATDPSEMPEQEEGKLVMICVGHHPDAQGAQNNTGHFTGMTEWRFNRDLAPEIAKRMKVNRPMVRARIERNWSVSSINSVINSQKPVVVIELHANAFDRNATGTEMLYWHSSEGGERLAQELENAVVAALGLRYRGVKSRESGDRGALFLQKTAMPAVLCESFFIDNSRDLAIAIQKRSELAQAYADVLDAL